MPLIPFMSRCPILRVRPMFNAGFRCILSDAYLCEDMWQKRLESPLLKDIKPDLYFIETDKKFGTKRLVSGVEIDLFASKVEENSKLEELEHLLFRFRRTKRAAEMMDSTHYAVVKVFLKCKEYKSLMRILVNPASYGVFPDLYSYNAVMSTFINEKMYIEAAHVAVLMMLQENFENKISCALGLYSCQLFLNNCALEDLKSHTAQGEDLNEKTSENEEDEDVQLERVPFILNPWFDDHFDITDPKHLIGKTLYLLGRQIPSICGRSYQLVGLSMYEKWDKAYTLMTKFSDSEDDTILSEAVFNIKSHITEISDDEKNTKGEWKNKFEKLIEKLKSQNKVKDGELMTSLESELKTALAAEKDDIASQEQLFPLWEQERRLALQKLNASMEKERRLKAVEEKKEYLFWKEKKLFFFENVDKNMEDLRKAEEVVASLKEKKLLVDTYMPPEMTKQRRQKLTKYQKLVRVKKI